MPEVKPRPSFGGRLNNAEYYARVASVISVLRDTASLRVIAQHLARLGVLTPTGLTFNRERVRSFIRSN